MPTVGASKCPVTIGRRTAPGQRLPAAMQRVGSVARDAQPIAKAYLRKPGKPAVSKLLGLLKTGELKAGFEFPGTKVCWIPIPTSYWTGVSSHKFGSLRYIEHDKRKTGT